MSPITPPGLTLGPLLRDYTMQAWEDSAPATLQSRSDWATAALLHRLPTDPAAPPSTSQSRRWELLVECRMSVKANDLDSLRRESVRVFFGPTTRPTSIIRVDLTGVVTNEAAPDPLQPPEMEAPPGHVEIV